MTPFGKRDERISRTEQNRFRKFPFSAHRNELFSLPRSEKPDTRIRAFHPWGISTGHAGVCLNQTSSPTRTGPDSGCEAAAIFKFPRTQEPFHPTSPRPVRRRFPAHGEKLHLNLSGARRLPAPREQNFGPPVRRWPHFFHTRLSPRGSAFDRSRPSQQEGGRLAPSVRESLPLSPAFAPIP